MDAGIRCQAPAGLGNEVIGNRASFLVSWRDGRRLRREAEMVQNPLYRFGFFDGRDDADGAATESANGNIDVDTRFKSWDHE